MEKTFKIKGMHCDSCAKLIESELKDKVESISIDKKGNAKIKFDQNKIKENEISALFNTLIYSVDELKRNFGVNQNLRNLFIQVKEETKIEFDAWLRVFQENDLTETGQSDR